ncbi:MAG: hypothetical protein IKI75_13190 [Lachnospiraceae bacterium]|nr:hypothetical protein [Lachnospiraceae bacterium]
MKRIVLLSICAVLLAGCGNGGDEMFGIWNNRNAEARGVTDRSDPKADKNITSEDLKSFSLTFESQGCTVPSEDGSSGPAVYPWGRYSFEMKEDGGAVTVKADFAGDNYEFEADASELKNLARMLKDNNVSAMNGHSKRNSALGDYIDLEADYAGGEKISIYAEGGASAVPYEWRDDIYLTFFDELVERYTGQSFSDSKIEDNSDPDAVKSFSSDEIKEIYVEFGTDPVNGNRKGFPYGTYRLQLKGEGLPYTYVDKTCAVWRDNGVVAQFDHSDEDLQALKDWIEQKGFKALNGWDKNGTAGSSISMELHVYYADGESLMLDARGEAAMPPGWDPIEFLQLVQSIAEKHGETLL